MITINKNNKKSLLRLNLGCGLHVPSGWINIDGSLSARLAKISWLYRLLCKFFGIEHLPWPRNILIANLTKGLPFADREAAAIFSSHTLEHLSQEDGRFLIQECFRVLASGGVLRIIVPDLHQFSINYIKCLKNNPEIDKGDCSRRFIENLNIFDKGKSGRVTKWLKNLFSFNRHLYMYDKWSLIELLRKNGFREVELMSYGQSRIPNVTEVEERERHEESICVEGVKQ